MISYESHIRCQDIIERTRSEQHHQHFSQDVTNFAISVSAKPSDQNIPINDQLFAHAFADTIDSTRERLARAYTKSARSSVGCSQEHGTASDAHYTRLGGCRTKISFIFIQ